jgi:hypothetical protein
VPRGERRAVGVSGCLFFGEYRAIIRGLDWKPSTYRPGILLDSDKSLLSRDLNP